MKDAGVAIDYVLEIDVPFSEITERMSGRYVPARMSGFMMGAYFVATGVSQYLGSVVANFAQMPSHDLDAVQSLPRYLELFKGLGWLAAAGMVIALLLYHFFQLVVAAPIASRLASSPHRPESAGYGAPTTRS